MKPRERKYIQRRKIILLFNRYYKPDGELLNEFFSDLFFYGMTGSENIVLGDGTLQQRPLTIDEMFKLKDGIDFVEPRPESFDGEKYNKFHTDEFGQWANP